MAIPRFIPVLLLQDNGLVKTTQFKDPKYIGDPLNAVKIFNEKEVDELIFLDIHATNKKTPIPLDFIKEVAEECFMPLAYGGGIKTIEDIRSVLKVGVEKVILNSCIFEEANILSEAIKQFGSSTICVCLDVKKNFWGKQEVYSHGGTKSTKKEPVAFAKYLDDLGVGELMINSIDRDGKMNGYDIELIKKITDSVSIPVIACGGAGSVSDFNQAINFAGASACAAGSMFVFHGRLRAVLISYPEQQELLKIIQQKNTTT
jgi:imidazole glycerol-phosphate synthase subunit HisF